MARYFGRMWRYAPWICLGHALGWGLVNLTGLAPGLLVARYLNLIEADGSRRDLIVTVALVVGLALFWFGLVLLAGFLEIQMRFRMSGLVRFNLLRTLLERYGAAALPFPIGQTISRFRDDGYAAEDVLDWSDEIILHTLFGIIALIILATIDPWITVAVTVPMVTVVAGAHLLGGRITRTRQASSQATSEITGAIAGMLSATAAIQTAGAERSVIARFTDLNAQRRDLMVRDAVATTLVSAFARSAAGITTGVVMLVAADSVRSRDLSVGDFALFVIWVGFLTQ
ncbi:MAG: ABC transporter ATP-binding protein, partial [Thermomicrobiales bacterium]|nr:ABC transporter ATP-binding protein [Thermomicrobiales bacterium]